MITNPRRKTVLCYGDSNTNGQKPASYGRFAITERWTGLLQDLLGPDFEIIEEGLSGRTVNLDDPEREGKNGRAYFVPCLGSHRPLDLVVIMLGTNDVKVKFSREVRDIVDGLRELVLLTQADKCPVLMVSPVILNPKASEWDFFGESSFDEMSARKSVELVGQLREMAQEVGCAYAAASDVVTLGNDGIHFDSDGHKKFAEMLAGTVRVLV